MTLSEPLPHDRFAAVVRDTPLVAFDLIVRAPDGTMLVGLRTNQPARGTWFVPGGVIRKGEQLDDAFRRIARDELGFDVERAEASFLGVHEHHYATNFAEAPGYGTHYVVLAHEVRLEAKPSSVPVEQHGRFRWLTDDELRADPDVHPNVKAYVP